MLRQYWTAMTYIGNVEAILDRDDLGNVEAVLDMHVVQSYLTIQSSMATHKSVCQKKYM